MSIKNFISFLSTFCLTAALTFTSCKETGPQVKPVETETYLNQFDFEGTPLGIGSVVRFEQDNNTVQFWISPNSGMTDIDEMAEDGNCVVLSVHKSCIGSRDRFTKSGSFVKYGNKVFATGDAGIGYIETKVTGDTVALRFAIEKLHTKSEPAVTLSGEYKGVFTTFTDVPYSNEWAIERDRFALSSAKMTVREDGGCDTYTLYESNSNEAIEFTMPQSYRGNIALFNTNDKPVDGVTVKYNGGKAMTLSEAYGSITADFDEAKMMVSFDLTYEGKRIRAEYEGAYSQETRKANRYIYSSGYQYETHYNGRFMFSELRLEKKGNSYVFKFVPVGTDEMYSDIPELVISDLSLIGKSDIKMRTTKGWHFEFDKINVDPYENEWKPAPSEDSRMTIYETEEGYYVDIELATKEPTFGYLSTIDLHYEGPVTLK